MKAGSALPLLQKPLHGKFILLYGSDLSLSAMRVEIFRRFARKRADSVIFKSTTLSSLYEDDSTFSLFESPSEQTFYLLEKTPEKEVLAYLKSDAFLNSKHTLIYEAPALRRGSPLLTFAESSERSFAISCYEPLMDELKQICAAILDHSTTPYDQQVLNYLSTYFLDAPSSIFLEMEKLSLLISADTEKLTITHVQEILRTHHKGLTDDILLWLTERNLEALIAFAENEFSELQNVIFCARALQRHFVTLIELKAETNKGLSPSAALSKLPQKPFFQTAKVYERILPRWNQEHLMLGLKQSLELERLAKSSLIPLQAILVQTLLNSVNVSLKGNVL